MGNDTAGRQGRTGMFRSLIPRIEGIAFVLALAFAAAMTFGLLG